MYDERQMYDEMYDLSSTLFFKGKFEIAANQEGFDLLWCVVRHIRDWMCKKWEQKDESITRNNHDWTDWKNGGKIFSQNGRVRFKSIRCVDEKTGQINWACRINERFPSRNGCAPRSWTTEVGFQSAGADRAVLSIVLYYSDRPGFIGPCEPPVPPSIPNLIRNLCADGDIACTVDTHPLTLRPILLKPGDFPDFWRVVSDESREIPVVYLSPRKREDGGVNLLDPQNLAWNVLGPNALVYYAEDPDFSREMHQMQSDYGCYDGSIRVYAPHPRVEERNDLLRHRYIPSREILEMGPEQTCEILRRALAQDVEFYKEQMFRVENCQRLLAQYTREVHMQQLRETLEQDKRRYRENLRQEMEQYKGSLDQEMEQRQQTLEDTFLDPILEAQRKLEEERDILENHCEALEEDLQDLRQQLFNSQEREENYRQAMEQAQENALEGLRPLFLECPTDPKAIAEAVMALYPDRIDFTDRGWKTLEKQCKGKDPAVVWRVLLEMATTLYELYDDGAGAIDEAFNHRCKGLSLAFSESGTTHQNKKLMRQYQDTYQGQEIQVEPHIKTTESKEESKNFLRVYYCPFRGREAPGDGKPRGRELRESLRIVIGSIGDHFTTAGTKRMH